MRVNDLQLDPVGSPILVDNIVTERQLNPSNQFTNVEEVEGQYGYGHLHMNYRISCTGSFGGLNCTAFCGVEGCGEFSIVCMCIVYLSTTKINVAIDLLTRQEPDHTSFNILIVAKQIDSLLNLEYSHTSTCCSSTERVHCAATCWKNTFVMICLVGA